MIAPHQRTEDGNHCLQGACIVRHRWERDHRRLGRAANAETARHRLVVEVVAGGEPRRPGLAEAGKGAVDQAGVDLLQPRRSKAQALHRAGAVGFQKDIRQPHEVDKLRPSLG